MKEEILTHIVSVINALNCIEVRGKANLMNLGGSIDVLEHVAAAIKKEKMCGEDTAEEV